MVNARPARRARDGFCRRRPARAGPHRLNDRGRGLAVEFHRCDAAVDAVWILDRDFIAGSVILEHDLKARPEFGNARGENERCRLHLEPQDRLKARPVHPARRACVPRPSAAPDVRRHRVDVGGDHIGFHFVAMHLRARARVIDGIQHREELASPIALPEACKREYRPGGGVGVLAAVLADAGRIALDVAGFERCLIEGRREEEREPR